MDNKIELPGYSTLPKRNEEGRNAIKAMALGGPLQSSEYFNRKLIAAGISPEQLMQAMNGRGQGIDISLPLGKVSDRYSVDSVDEYQEPYRKCPTEDQSGMMREVQEQLLEMGSTAPEFAIKDHWCAITAQQFSFGDAARHNFSLEGYNTSLELPYPECTFEFEDRQKKAVLYVKQHRVKNGMYNNGVPVILCKLFFKESDDKPWEYNNFLYRIQNANGTGMLRMMIDMDKPNQRHIANDHRRRWKSLFERYTTPLLALLHGLANKQMVIVMPSGNLHTAGDVKTEDGTSVVWMSATIRKANEHLGGTHASPREHDRIAHDRRLPNGKTIRIQAQVINKGVEGRITKTYRIKKDAAK